MFPKSNIKPIVPPVKCQGIKTKLVSFIAQNIKWSEEGMWIEPFLGSGVVLFSLQPKRATVSDINPHLITLYASIFEGKINPAIVKEHLTNEGRRMQEKGEKVYYEIRERFNTDKNPLDFLLLNRACFNGLIRFNNNGDFNVPFCRKNNRFRPAYVSKIVNQVRAVQKIMQTKDWTFLNLDWCECLKLAGEDDFVYLDPPYIGRHTDYFNRWSDKDAIEMAESVQTLDCGYALSMWKENKFRINEHIEEFWQDNDTFIFNHFYHIGSSENYRNAIVEALVIKKGFSATENEQIKICKMLIPQVALSL
ncbi:MAG: Dam family site-specific DNA-(adenine-N6)-methyltransferase [Calditrichaeota bacterium]|nr:Dam family site-specific DNA-(adenine-N6)-methyltransferase [Calditrichota bacterium]